MKSVGTKSWMRFAAAAVLVLTSRWSGAESYQFHVIASGLHRPLGIAVSGKRTIYFTEVPTPGVAAGSNSVSKLNLKTGERTILHAGEPEPTNIALGRDGEVYWTCKSAGVILVQDEDGETRMFLSGLSRPTGIAVDRDELVWFTTIPDPGIPGGRNLVAASDGAVIFTRHMGDPEPTDVVVGPHRAAYWTCKSAGVILMQVNDVTTVLLSGLDHPTGIALDHEGKRLFFTEVPTPGVPGSAGGRNKVWEVDLRSLDRHLVHEGDPEPTDVAVAKNGNVYWTCTSAGVIVEASPVRGR